MFRNARYFGKNEGKHNYYGEQEIAQENDNIEIESETTNHERNLDDDETSGG